MHSDPQKPGEAFWAYKTFPESFKTPETSTGALEKENLSLHLQQAEKQLLLKWLKHLSVLCLEELKGISWDMVIPAWKKIHNWQVIIYDAVLYYVIWGVLVQPRRVIAAMLL